MKTIFSLITLCLPVTLLYGQFFWNPVIFDDIYFFDGSVHEQYLGKVFSFDLRWLPYATLIMQKSLNPRYIASLYSFNKESAC